MPKPLTADELVARAQVELDKAERAHLETVTLGRTAGRTTRMRAAKHIFESGPPDPEFGAPEWIALRRATKAKL